jgi:hypothetical protein
MLVCGEALRNREGSISPATDLPRSRSQRAAKRKRRVAAELDSYVGPPRHGGQSAAVYPLDARSLRCRVSRNLVKFPDDLR